MGSVGMVQTRYGGAGGMVAGIVMVVAGIGLTVLSRASAPPGGVYVVFVGLIFTGMWRIAASAMAPRLGARRTGAARPASVPEMGYYALPAEAPEGVCWQCGARLRRTGSLCYACGATRPNLRALRPAAMYDTPPARPQATPSDALWRRAVARWPGAAADAPAGRSTPRGQGGAPRDGRRPFGPQLPPAGMPREALR